MGAQKQQVQEATRRTEVDAGMRALMLHSTDEVTYVFLQLTLEIEATFFYFDT